MIYFISRIFFESITPIIKQF